MKLALGTVQFGKEYGIQKNKKPEPVESIKLLASAAKAGINAFDTAAAYGNAESILGEFISGGYVQRNMISIITKLPLGVLDDVPAGDYQSTLEKESAQSLGRMKTDYLDGLLFHDAKSVYDAKAMNALNKTKCRGYINSVGVSVYTPEEAIKATSYDIDIIQIPYNIFDRRLDRIGFFEEAKEREIMVFARSPLLQGLLAMRPADIPPHMQFVMPHLLRFNETCEELKLTPLECAIMFAAKHPYIDYLLFGIDNANQLEEVTCAFHKSMDDSAYQLLCELFSDIPEQIIMPNFWPAEG